MNELIQCAGLLLSGVDGQALYNLLPGPSAKLWYVLFYSAMVILTLGVASDWSLVGYWLGFLIYCVCGRSVE